MECRNENKVTELKLARIKSGLKAYQLAQRIRISPTELCLYEQNRRRCTANIRYKIAEILEISVDELFPNEEKEGL